jgi:hypothetical protein
MVALAIKDAGASICQQAMNDTRAPDVVVRRALTMLGSAGESQRTLGRALPMEYAFFKSRLLEPLSDVLAEMNLSIAEVNRWMAPFRAGGGIVMFPQTLSNWMPYFLYYTRLQPNRTLAQLGTDYREMEVSLRSPVDVLNDTAAAKNAHEGMWRSLLRRNSGGQMSVGIVVSQIVALGHSVYLQECRWTLLRAGLAARSYWDERGTLPPSLEALVPKYLAEVPHDPFSGAALHYDAARGLIWSVGKSRTDEGGSKRLRETAEEQVFDDPFMDDDQPTLVLKFAHPTTVPAAAGNKPTIAGK